MSQTAIQFTLTPNSSPVNTSQEVVASYTSSAGFAVGDKVQFIFEPVAGLVIDNTCSTPTTDADGDLTTDGSASILLGTTYEYTFSDAIANPSIVSFCMNVTGPGDQGSLAVQLTDDNGGYGVSLYYVGDANDVFVTANVAPSLSFNIRNLEDTADTNECSFGTISPSDAIPNYDNVDDGPSECGYSLAIGTNAASGFQVNAQADAWLDNMDSLIANIPNLGTFVAGEEAYGYANITPANTGRNPATGLYDQPILRVNWWDFTGFASYVPTTNEQMLSYTDGIEYTAGIDATDVTQMMHGLVVGSGTPAGYYQQEITYIVTANF